MALFLSTYVNKVDRKGRVSVPAPFRGTLSGQNYSGFVAFRSYRVPAIEALDMLRMEQISASADRLDLFSDEHDDLSATIFADATQLTFDGEGRITLPKDLADHADIADHAAFVGRGRTFQIWEPDAFIRHQEAARDRARSQRMTMRLHDPADADPNR